jgi:hypothetical protein
MDNERYESPQIVFEGNLEVQAGTEIGNDVASDWLDEEI